MKKVNDLHMNPDLRQKRTADPRTPEGAAAFRSDLERRIETLNGDHLLMDGRPVEGDPEDARSPLGKREFVEDLRALEAGQKPAKMSETWDKMIAKPVLDKTVLLTPAAGTNIVSINAPTAAEALENRIETNPTNVGESESTSNAGLATITELHRPNGDGSNNPHKPFTPSVA